MDEAMKTALKAILHEIVDKEEISVLQDLGTKLPANYQTAYQAILAGVGPAAIAAEDAMIDKI